MNDGSRVVLALRAFGSDEEAKRWIGELEAKLFYLVRNCQMGPVRQSPDGKVFVEPATKVTAFLSNLGLAGFSHGIREMKVGEDLIVKPAGPGIIKLH
jgi:hypothetical protein